jgi:hypothetical protein
LFPHSIGCLGGPCEDSALHRVQVKGAVDDARVPPARVDRNVLFLFDYRNSSLVPVGDPVADAGA